MRWHEAPIDPSAYFPHPWGGGLSERGTPVPFPTVWRGLQVAGVLGTQGPSTLSPQSYTLILLNPQPSALNRIPSTQMAIHLGTQEAGDKSIARATRGSEADMVVNV